MDDVLRRIMGEVDDTIRFQQITTPFSLDTPETIIARRHPLLELASLNLEARRNHKQTMEGLYNEGIAIGGGVAETYLSRLDSTQTARIKQIKVEPYVRSFTGRGRGMVITFRR